MDIFFESSSTFGFEWKTFRDTDVDTDAFTDRAYCFLLFSQIVRSLFLFFSYISLVLL